MTNLGLLIVLFSVSLYTVFVGIKIINFDQSYGHSIVFPMLSCFLCDIRLLDSKTTTRIFPFIGITSNHSNPDPGNR